jgi:hypothetical protein
MKPFPLSRVAFPYASGICLLAAALTARSDTLFFQPSLDAKGNITEAWSSVENWYFELTPMVVPANRLPESGDTVYIVLSEYACIVDVPMVEVNTLITQADIEGGYFSVLTIESSDTLFNGSILDVGDEWESDDDTLVDGVADILSGALLFLDGSTLTVNNSTLYDIGEIEMMNGGALDFGAETGMATNELKIAANAQFASVGNNSVNNTAGDPLIFDNNGTVQSENGTLLIESDSVFWTNSLGEGYFTNITSNAVIQIDGPFAVQTNCTNFISGPGTFLLYNGIETTINGLLQVGVGDPTPGTVDYHAFTLDGTGSINFTGAPGLPSTLIWESGTFAGPQVNIDSQSSLIISNTYLKTMTGSVIDNAGTVTWLTDGDTIQMDNGAVFLNLSGAVFTAENSAVIQGGAGSNASYFYNAGTLRKSVSSNSMNFAQDSPPAPSFYFLNLGLLDVETGTVYMEWGTNSGQYHVAQGAQLLLWAGTNVQEGTATFTGPGLLAVDNGDFWLPADHVMSNLLVEGNGIIDGPGDLTINGVLTLASGTAQGSGSLNINSNASLVLASNNFILYRNVTNAGMAVVTSVGVEAGQPLTWDNLPGSSLNLASAASLGNTVSYIGPPPVLDNAGTVSNSGPANLTSTIDWTVTNSGVIAANPYNLQLEQSLTQVSGSLEVASGAMLSVSSSFGHTLTIQGGVLEGKGEVSGSIVNSGTIHPGDSPGILTIGFGTLTNESGAELAVDIAGTTPGLQYSQLNDSGGQAWLHNLGLAVTFDNGFVPVVGQSFVIWTNTQINGVFSSLAGIQAGGVVLVPQYSPTMVTLVAANNPALLSPSITSNTFSSSFQTTAGLTNVVQYTPSLSPAVWQTLTKIVGDGLIESFTDNLSTNTSRFYRVTFE